MKDQTLCVHNIHPYVVDDEEEISEGAAVTHVETRI